MDTKTTLSTTAARRDIFKITKAVQKPGVVYTLTENGCPKAVIMSAQEFESWVETLEVRRDFPNLTQDIKEAESALAAGRTVSLADFLADEGYVLSGKGKNEKISTSTKSQNRQKSKKN